MERQRQQRDLGLAQKSLNKPKYAGQKTEQKRTSMYKQWPDLTNAETVYTVLAIGLVVYLLLRWACKTD